MTLKKYIYLILAYYIVSSIFIISILFLFKRANELSCDERAFYFGEDCTPETLSERILYTGGGLIGLVLSSIALYKFFPL